VAVIKISKTRYFDPRYIRGIAEQLNVIADNPDEATTKNCTHRDQKRDA